MGHVNCLVQWVPGTEEKFNEHINLLLMSLLVRDCLWAPSINLETLRQAEGRKPPSGGPEGRPAPPGCQEGFSVQQAPLGPSGHSQNGRESAQTLNKWSPERACNYTVGFLGRSLWEARCERDPRLRSSTKKKPSGGDSQMPQGWSPPVGARWGQGCPP